MVWCYVFDRCLGFTGRLPSAICSSIAQYSGSGKKLGDNKKIEGRMWREHQQMTHTHTPTSRWLGSRRARGWIECCRRIAIATSGAGSKGILPTSLSPEFTKVCKCPFTWCICLPRLVLSPSAVTVLLTSSVSSPPYRSLLSPTPSRDIRSPHTAQLPVTSHCATSCHVTLHGILSHYTVQPPVTSHG